MFINEADCHPRIDRLNRIDALLFAAPVYYVVLKYV